MHRITVIIALALVLLGLAPGCAPVRPAEAPWEPEARALLDQANALLAKRQYDQAFASVNAFLTRYPTSRQADRALFLAGDLTIIRRDHSRALSYYKELIEKHPRSPLTTDAKYKLGLCYYELKEYDLAIASLEDRGRIADPDRLRRSAEILAVSYAAKGRHASAVRELVFLAENAPNEKQRAGYRERIRETVDRQFSEDDLQAAAAGKAFPADAALLRLAAVQIEQRQFREAGATARRFLDAFPGHPERTRAEMLVNEAASKLAAPRYRIAALLPRSGPLTFFGDRVLRGIQLAVHAYNLKDPDNRVEVVVQDTEGSPDKAVASLKELAPKGIVASIGPLLTKEVEAVAQVLGTLQVPVITPAASGPGIGQLSPWLFRNALTSSAQAAAAARYAQGRGLKRFIVFYPDDAYGRDLARLFTRELGKDIEVLASIPYDPDTKDFLPYIRKAMEIDLRSQRIPIPDDDQERKNLYAVYQPGFDGMYLPGSAERVGLLIPQLAFYNLTGVTMIGSNNWHAADLIERADRYAEGAVFTDGFAPEDPAPHVLEMVEAYRSAYQDEPDILSAQAYDAARMVLSFLAQRKDTPAAVREGLQSLREFPGVSGTTSFAGSGEAEKKLYFLTVSGGKFRLLEN